MVNAVDIHQTKVGVCLVFYCLEARQFFQTRDMTTTVANGIAMIKSMRGYKRLRRRMGYRKMPFHEFLHQLWTMRKKAEVYEKYKTYLEGMK